MPSKSALKKQRQRQQQQQQQHGSGKKQKKRQPVVESSPPSDSSSVASGRFEESTLAAPAAVAAVRDEKVAAVGRGGLCVAADWMRRPLVKRLRKDARALYDYGAFTAAGLKKGGGEGE